MKGKSLVAGMLVVVLAAISGIVWNSGIDHKLSTPSYGFFHVDGDHMVANFGNTLVWLDGAGKENKSLDLAELNINLAGDYGFLQADQGRRDLLVYHRDFEPGFWFNFQSFLRVQETVDLTPRGRDGFYRCNLATKKCQPFGKNLPRLDSSFRLAVDDRDNTVYLAHTSAFKLYKIGSEGLVLAESGGSTFEFPNQIEMVGGELWVVDTNRHRIAKVSTATETFARVLSEFPARLGSKHLFPHDLAIDYSTEKLWVIIGDHTMRNGRIASYQYSGEPLGEMTGATGPDPLAIRFWKDTIWLADYDEPRLQRFTVDQNKLNEISGVESPTLALLAKQTRNQQVEGERLSNYGALAFFLVLIGGFIAAWKLEKQQTLAAFSGQNIEQLDRMVSAPPEITPNNEIFWITNTLGSRRKALLRSMYFSGGLYVIATLALILNDDPVSIKLWLLLVIITVGMMSIMGTAFWLIDQLSKQKLGVIGQSIILERNARNSISRACDLHYSDNYLIGNGVIVVLGNERHRFFDAKQLDRFVFPRLKDAAHLKAREQYKKLWQAREPLLIFIIAIMTVPLLGLLGMQLLQ